MEVVLPTRF